MFASRLARLTFAVALFAAVASSRAFGLEVIQLRTGQSGGVPGAPCSLDDSFRYNAVSVPPCPQPFRPVAFSAGDFAAATIGPKSTVLQPHPAWTASLPYDPLARWINPILIPGTCMGSSISALYACPFNVTTQATTCGLTATVEVCWLVDDALGDPTGPNPIGLYLNGSALDAAYAGGSYSQQFCHTQFNVPVVTGQNWFYVYQRDLGCGVSGVILSAKITVNTPLPCPHFLVYKFNDLNGDGVQQQNEPPLAGWTFNLFGPSGGSAISNANGIADFGCLVPGNYTVSEVPQPGWVVTSPIGGQQSFVVTCGEDYAVTFANHECGAQSSCVFPPKCLSAQWLFSECGGSIANETMANRDGTLMGTIPPVWVTGRTSSGCGLRFSATNDSRVEVPDAPELNVGNKSFTISAWVRTTDSSNSVRTVIDKRVVPFGSPTGYAIYLYGTQVYFQYNDGSSSYITLASTSAGVSDGAWHHIAVSVCRNPQNPSTNVARVVVDNHVDTFGSAFVPVGSLTNGANLRFGDQCPGFLVGRPFRGDIDDVLLFKCCLTPAQIQDIGATSEYCTDACYVPSILSTVNNAVNTTLTLCNYSTIPQTYTWTAAPIAGAHCNRTGPPVFLPPAGTVTVPGATSGPACVSIPITIQLPGGMNWLDLACYQITVLNQGTGRCCTTRGRVRKSFPVDPGTNPTQLTLHEGGTGNVQFTLVNDGPGPLSLSYVVSDHSSDDDPDNAAVRLNGLPPGEPVIGTLSIAPESFGVITVGVQLDQFQPENPHEVLLSADLDGDGQMEDLTACSVFSNGLYAPSDTPEPESVASFAGRPATLLALPNPFQGRTALHLFLPQRDGGVEAEVFDAGGRRVRELHAGALEAGDHVLSWDARDAQGRLVPSGLYFVRVSGRTLHIEQKVLRIE